jgi:hypothetical protein
MHKTAKNKKISPIYLQCDHDIFNIFWTSARGILGYRDRYWDRKVHLWLISRMFHWDIRNIKKSNTFIVGLHGDKTYNTLV